MPSRPNLPPAIAILATAAVLALAAVAPVAAKDAVVTYHIPFEAGARVLVTQGWHGPYSHAGVASFAYDFVLPEGTPVLAAAAGRVSYAHGGETACGGEELLEHANFVTIDHADGTATHYGHLAGVTVAVGQKVEAGQVIGQLGSTGFTNCTTHLHFARQLQGGAVTESVPIYFAEHPERELVTGEVVVGQLLAVVGPVPLELQQDLQVELRTDIEMRQDARQRVEALRSFDPLRSLHARAYASMTGQAADPSAPEAAGATP